ncbi:hypothetical protein Q7P37_011204 [Cladosporium fusiforme]
MPVDVARQWFVPGDGIDRHVIVTDIQRYLGNDATVRPGKGTGENEGVTGYWIKAYRNLTTAMIADLRADSARWRQEQRMPGTAKGGSQSPRVLNQAGNPVPDKVPDYVGSHTYHNSQAARAPRSRDGDSPAVEVPLFGSSLPSSRAPMPMDRIPVDNRMPAERMPAERIPVSRGPAERIPMDTRMDTRMDPRMDARMDTRMQNDRMDIDSSSGPPQGRYTQERNGYSDPRYGGADPRSFSDSRPAYPQPEQSSYGRVPPVTSSYGQDPVYAPSRGYPPQTSDGPQSGYVRHPQGNYYVPMSSAEPPGRQDAPMYGVPTNYGQQLQPQRSEGRDLRDPRELSRDPRDPRDPRDMRADSRDPRYSQDYPQDPRYAYPSPAATTASLPPTRERESIASPSQQRFADPCQYGSAQYDQYPNTRQGTFPPPTPGQNGQPGQRFGTQPPNPGYGGQRPPGPPSNDSTRNAPRKRQQ